MKQAYKDQRFTADSLAMISTMNGIVRDYVAQGFVLTVRQLYYQLVARDIIPNSERSYKRITGLVNDARMAGLMDWDAIEDRTRAFVRRPSWNDPGEIIRSAANSYHEDIWDTQSNRVFVIVEKEALVGVLERVCYDYDVPLLAARGYPSGTVLREFARGDIMNAHTFGQHPVILHLGDHDPSGIDMTRDLEDRLRLFSECEAFGESLTLERIALTMDQIEEQRPPENPAKSTDARFAEYRRKYGSSSWELDALTPTYLVDLVTRHIENFLDTDAFERRQMEVGRAKKRLNELANSFQSGV